MKIALVYARVSTDEQAEEGKSIETQIKLATKWTKDNGYVIAENGIYKDEGKSATTLNRQALKDMLARCIGDEHIDIVLVQDTDRLARNTLDHLTIKSILKKKEIQLISISQPMLDDSPEGTLVDTIIASVNAFFSQLTGRKVSKVLEEKAQMGWYPGGRPPIGYKNIENPNPESTLDEKIIAIDQSTAPYVKKMFEMYLTNSFNVQQIADWLNKKGVKSVNGLLLAPSTVDNYLKNKFYIGEFQWAGKNYKGKHEKLIDDELFYKVQDLLTERNQNASRKRIHNFLLSGFVYCSKCGSRFWAERHTKKGVTYDHYYCSNCKTGTYTDVVKLEKKVEKLFQKIELSKEYSKEIMDKALAMIKDLRENTDVEKSKLTLRKNQIEKALKDLEDERFLYKTVTDEKYQSISSRYEKNIADIEDDISKLGLDKSKKIKSLDELLRLAENIGLAYFEAKPGLKRIYLKMFFKKIYISEGKIIKYDLSDEVNDLIKNGSVRVRQNGLALLDSNQKPFR